MTAAGATPKNVVLTGFMGTGKTTVGRVLADLLGWSFLDTDQIIEERHGPIPALFENLGEAGFRALEREVATNVAARRRVVIATGGGLLMDRLNALALAETGRIYCLVAEPDEILTRLGGGDTPHRPLLGSGGRREQIVELLNERAEVYSAFEQISTNDRTPQDVANKIHGLHSH